MAKTKVKSEQITPNILLPFGVYLDIQPFSVTNKYPYSQTVNRDMTFVKWAQTVFVVTTNSGISYWKMSLIRWSDNAVIKLLDTSAISPSVNTTLVATTFTIPTLSASNLGLYVLVEKVGTPGNLYMAGPSLEVTLTG